MKNVYFLKNQDRPWRFSKMINGKRITRNFSSKKQCEDFAKKFIESQAALGNDALFFLKEDKILLQKIKEICGNFDPLEAVRFWKENYIHGKSDSVPPVREAFDQFIAWLESSNRRARTISSMRTIRNKFVDYFSKTPLTQIGQRQLLEWVERVMPNAAPKSIKNHISGAINFLNWCKIAKSWIVNVPVIDDRILPKRIKEPVHIWTSSEAETAIRHIEEHERPYLAHYVLRLFAGLRTSEASQMRWEWIDFENLKITVPAHICKTRDAWLILPEFCPVSVWEWLKVVREECGQIKKPHERVNTRIMSACNGKPNIMRHTFATMHVALYGDESKTILATRHTNIGTLRANYRGVNQTKADAERFFALRPLKG